MKVVVERCTCNFAIAAQTDSGRSVFRKHKIDCIYFISCTNPVNKKKDKKRPEEN